MTILVEKHQLSVVDSVKTLTKHQRLRLRGCESVLRRRPEDSSWIHPLPPVVKGRVQLELPGRSPPPIRAM